MRYSNVLKNIGIAARGRFIHFDDLTAGRLFFIIKAGFNFAPTLLKREGVIFLKIKLKT